MKWILWSDRLPEPAQDTRFVHTRKAFLLPRVPEVFLACSKKFCCWPKADTSLAEAMRKNLWHELLLFTVPIDLWAFYQITSLAPMVLFLRPCNRSFIAQCCLVNFCIFHGPRQIRTNLVNTITAVMFTSGSVNKVNHNCKCYTFTKLPVFEVIIIIITYMHKTCELCLHNLCFICQHFSHVSGSYIFTTTTKVCSKKDSASFPSFTSPERCGSTGQVAYYGTTNKPTLARVS